MVVVAAAAALAVTGRRHATRTSALGQEMADRTSALSGRVVDVLGGLREVLGYRLQDRVRAEVAEAGTRVAEASGRLETANRMLAAVREAVVTVTSAAVLAVASLDDVAPALVPAVVVLALVTIAPVADATATIAQLHPLRASAVRVRNELWRPAVVPRAPEPGVALPDGPLGLVFRDVSFRYGDRQVLEGFCLDVAPGEHVALAGPSGIGKSTVVALAGRLWDPDAGQVALVGESCEVSLRSLDDAELRRTVAVVEQGGRLFSGTVADNLLVHDRSRRADLVAGLEALDLAQVIGPEDQLGEGGVRLSAGQQARLRLLRAILARPRVLVVDEPTADLDLASAAKVHDVLYSSPSTLLLISHQEKTLRGADRVVSLARASHAQKVRRTAPTERHVAAPRQLPLL
jgi:ABC-type multidrug transport system fused ATPase/permease subunit